MLLITGDQLLLREPGPDSRRHQAVISKSWNGKGYPGAEPSSVNSMATENHEDIKQTIRRFLLDSINIPGINDEDDLFEIGIVNSLFAVQLMTFIEKTFCVEVETDDLDIENFKSLNAASIFVVKKKARLNTRSLKQSDR